MKTIIIIIVILFTTSFTGCDNKTSEEGIPEGKEYTHQKNDQIDSLLSEQKPETLAISFLAWYRDNRNNLSSFQLVKNANEENFDSTKFYSVNFQETDKYLNAINKSNFVSVQFISTWRDYFKKADKHFQDNPQNDGPPANFEYDLIMQSQEIDSDLENIVKTKVASQLVTGEKVLLTLLLLSGQKLKVTLSKEDKKWLIDNIENANRR